MPLSPLIAIGAVVGATVEKSCDALNRQRNIDTHRTNQVTKAVLCETRPTPCVSEFLFSHEFYWSEQRAKEAGGAKCSKWVADEDWPTREPHLTRPAGLGGLWESVLRQMPNRTLWLHGDSIMTQVCEAALCSLARSAVVPQPPLCIASSRHPSTPHCADIDELSRDVSMQIRGATLPNGARLLCSAVGVFERRKILEVLRRARASVVVINYGLHYHSNHSFADMLQTLLGDLAAWTKGAPGRVPLYRELSAQHFKGGSWRPGAERPPAGTPCECERLDARGATDVHERTAANQNKEFNHILGTMAAATSNPNAEPQP